MFLCRLFDQHFDDFGNRCCVDTFGESRSLLRSIFDVYVPLPSEHVDNAKLGAVFSFGLGLVVMF